jgi:FemAB-related protein (PEP-CTERM system-associated)
MNVVICDEAHAESWNRYVAQHAAGSFYHLFEWRRINAEELGHRSFYLAAFDGDRIRGIFPFVQVRSWMFGNLACSMPFVNYGGPVVDDEAVERLLLEAAHKICVEQRVDYLEIRSPRPVGGELETSTHKISMVVALDPGHEALWTKFKTGHRQDIRKGYKNGLSAKHGGGELLDPFYAVLTQSWRKLGTPLYRRSYFESIVKAFPGRIRITVVFKDDRPAAAAFVGMWKGVAEGMWLGSLGEYRSLLVGYVLYWELLKDACEQGLHRYHLGRSSVDSTGENFKKKWCAEPRQLYWQYMLLGRKEVPQLNPNNPKYRFAIEAWRRLPISVTQRLGPLLARNIP